MNEPKLRFKADDGSQFPDWEEKTIDEVAECLDNKRVPVNSEERKKRVGIIPYYGAGGIQGYIDDYLFDEELVLLLEDGDAFDDFQTKSIAQYVTGKSWVNNHAHVLRANGNSYFLFASLEHKDIRRWTQLAGASRKKLLKDSMLKITVNMPSLPEQQKIAEFLSTIDTVIGKQKETVSAWEERKKGVMQKLFSQEVRFKADDGSEFPEWEENIGCNRINIINGKPFDSKKFTTVDNGNPIIRIRDLDECTITLYSTEKYEAKYKVKKGSILIGMDGDFSVVKWNNVDVGLNQRIMHVIGKNDYIDDFMYYQLMPLIHEINVRTPFSTVKHLSSNTVLNMKLLIPCLEEQQKIADCLSSLDEVIEKQKATLAAWEELKKGLLQQMFI